MNMVNNNNVILNIIQGQDNTKISPQAQPTIQTQKPQEESFRRSSRERRNAILNDYVVFLQENKYDIGLV